MKIPFTKCEANGNDFIFIFLNDFPEVDEKKELISRLCCRYTGIGADGFFIIDESPINDFRLDYYNADGSWETFCANGSRCAVSLMHQRNNKPRVSFETGVGVHLAYINKDATVSMQMATPSYISDRLAPAGIAGFHIDSGAAHFVCESDNLSDEYVIERGKNIRYHSLFQPRGINVNFYSLVSENHIEVRTYEKGVESLMRSCSSGSAAVVYHLAKSRDISSPVTTVSPGGRLCFNFDKPWQNAWNASLPDHLKLNVKSAKLSQIYRRLDPNKPSYTITGSGGGGTHGYHWKEHRALTNRERARLQTFPDDFIFSGKKESVRKQIGMAVSPKMSQIIFESVLKTLAKVKYKSVASNISVEHFRQTELF